MATQGPSVGGLCVGGVFFFKVNLSYFILYLFILRSRRFIGLSLVPAIPWHHSPAQGWGFAGRRHSEGTSAVAAGDGRSWLPVRRAGFKLPIPAHERLLAVCGGLRAKAGLLCIMKLPSKKKISWRLLEFTKCWVLRGRGCSKPSSFKLESKGPHCGTVGLCVIADCQCQWPLVLVGQCQWASGVRLSCS